MSFSVPLFVLLLAPMILQEHVGWPIWMATLGGLMGICVILLPDLQALDQGAWFFLLAAILFAFLDVLNKKYITQEPMLNMLFYAHVVAMFLAAFPAASNWQAPTSREIGWLMCLGIGGNLILYCLLRAFSLASASSLAPFRYLELLISIQASHLFFHELPTTYSYAGAAIIIPCTLFIGYYQTRKTEPRQ
jgi:S-adenosylmethionine uptake transporter